MAYWTLRWLAKSKRKSTKGLRGKYKLILQILTAFIAVYLINQQFPMDYTNTVSLPFFKELVIDLGIFYLPFGILVIVGSSMQLI